MELEMNQPKEEILWVPWPKEDEIRWVQQRICERESIESRKSAALSPTGQCELLDYRAWLLHERDDLSFYEIGEMLFARCAGLENRKMRAYRAHDRVEGEFRRGHLKRDRESFGFCIHAFGLFPRPQ